MTWIASPQKARLATTRELCNNAKRQSSFIFSSDAKVSKNEIEAYTSSEGKAKTRSIKKKTLKDPKDNAIAKLLIINPAIPADLRKKLAKELHDNYANQVSRDNMMRAFAGATLALHTYPFSASTVAKEYVNLYYAANTSPLQASNEEAKKINDKLSTFFEKNFGMKIEDNKILDNFGYTEKARNNYLRVKVKNFLDDLGKQQTSFFGIKKISDPATNKAFTNLIKAFTNLMNNYVNASNQKDKTAKNYELPKLVNDLYEACTKAKNRKLQKCIEKHFSSVLSIAKKQTLGERLKKIMSTGMSKRHQ
jgi:hypothetical protein